jgi:hypothetical protein
MQKRKQDNYRDVTFSSALKIRGIKDEWKEGTMDFFLLQNEGLLP